MSTIAAFRSWLDHQPHHTRARDALDAPHGPAAFAALAAVPLGIRVPASGQDTHVEFYAPTLDARVQIDLGLRSTSRPLHHRVTVGTGPRQQRLVFTAAGWKPEPSAGLLNALRHHAVGAYFGLAAPGEGPVLRTPVERQSLADSLLASVPDWLASNGREVLAGTLEEKPGGTWVSWPEADGAGVFSVLIQSRHPSVATVARYKVEGQPPIVTPTIHGDGGQQAERIFDRSWLAGLRRALMDLSYRMERMACLPAKHQIPVTGHSEDNAAYDRDKYTKAISRGYSAEWDKLAAVSRQLAEKHGVRFGKQLGCGMYACAYEAEHEPEKVIKLSGDPADAAAWSAVLRVAKRAWPKSLIRTYCVEAFPWFADPEVMDIDGVRLEADDNRRMYFFVQERATGLTPAETAFLDTRNVLDEILGAAGVRGHTGSLARAIGLAVFHDIDWRLIHELLQTMRWLKKNGIGWHDLKASNVMAVGEGAERRLVIVDLGASEAPTGRIPVINP